VRSKEPYEGPDFAGKGKLRCYICDRPIIEHPIGLPCPFSPVLNPRTPKKVGHT
jgi:hypothetical protein